MNETQTKKCQNCQIEFIIESDDFDFYAKMQVPPPTWCPECRMTRRFIYRNERTLYKRMCGLCNKSVLTIYKPESPIPVYCGECWWSDKWDAAQYEMDYDFSKSFFLQFAMMRDRIPRPNLFAENNVDCEYANNIRESKNVYYSFSIVKSENIYYSTHAIDKSNFCFDSANVTSSSNVYYDIQGIRNYNSEYLLNCRECINSYFLFNCVNCSNCILSSNKRNQHFLFLNQQLSENEYKTRLQKLDLGSYVSAHEFLLEKYQELIKKSLHRFANTIKINNTTGDYIFNVSKGRYIFDSHDDENVKYCYRCPFLKDSMDTMFFREGELIYEYTNLGKTGQHIMFSETAFSGNSDVQYCQLVKSSQNLFACIGLRNKQYCILNKQYTKEEYESLVPKIIEHMNTMPYVDKQGRVYTYGEFFPPELSPFAYNESVAQEYFPLTKEQAEKQGYRWKEEKERNYQITKKPEELPDHIKDVDDDIVEQVIACAHNQTCNEQCTQAFKIIPDELQFYKRMNLPLPRLCPNCRHYERLRQRNPLKLWKRQCMCNSRMSDVRSQMSDVVYTNTATHFHGNQLCPNEFETSYAPERPEIVYCEQCYNAEVV